MPNKFKAEKFITQRYSYTTGLWTFRVNVQKANTCKSFSEAKYNDAKIAYEHAIAFRDEVLFNYSKGFITHATDATIRDVFYDSFNLFVVRQETKRKLIIYYNKYINRDELITNVNQSMILESMNDMIETCSNDTIDRIFSIWKRIIKTAIAKDYISKDFTVGVNVPKSHRIEKPKRSAVTDKDTLMEVIKLCKDHLASKYERKSYPLFLMFMYYTGARPAEVFALSKNDVDDNYIHINKEVGSSIVEANVIRTCKTQQSIRDIPISKEIKTIVESAKKLSKCDILFANEYETYYTSNDVGSKLKKLCDRYGIEFRLYQLRHLFSTDMLKNNIDLRTIQELMGHASYSMTLDYARSNDSDKLKALKKR